MLPHCQLLKLYGASATRFGCHVLTLRAQALQKKVDAPIIAIAPDEKNYEEYDNVVDNLFKPSKKKNIKLFQLKM